MEEDKNTTDSETSENKVAFAASGSKNRNKFNKNKSKIVCHKCGEPGHIKPKCPKNKWCKECKKDNHNDDECIKKKTKVNYGRSFAPCTHCRRTNHPESDCYFKDQNKSPSNGKVAFLAEADLGEVKNDAYVYCVDSGCTLHITNAKEALSDTEKSDVHINSAKKGVNMSSNVCGKIDNENILLKNVSYVPELARNLLSVKCVVENDGEVRFKKGKVEIYKNKDLVISGTQTESGLFVVDLRKQAEANMANKNEIMDWHRKLGHVGLSNLKKIPAFCQGVPSHLSKSNEPLCEICAVANMKRNSFNSKRQRATRPLQIIHTDLCGKITPPIFDDKNYFMTCIDDYSHHVTVYLLETKSEAENCLMEYILESENHHNLKVSKIRMDNGGEYRSNDFKNWCKTKGILLDYTIPHTPQLNGTAERMNLTLQNKMRAMLQDSKLPNKMWGTAVQTAAYLQNRTPSETIDSTPYQKWHNRVPDLKLLQIYGSTVYTKILTDLKKLNQRGKKGIFVGYALNGYRIWDEETNQIYVSKDAAFFGIQNEEINNQPIFNVENAI